MSNRKKNQSRDKKREMSKKCCVCKKKGCKTDYVVIGVGAAGSMVCRLLTNDFKTSVVGIERGSYLADDPVVVDNINLAAPLRRPKNDDMYELNEQNQANGQGILGNFNMEFGKGGPGGTTVHYFGNATRGTQWDEWAQIVNDPSWNYDNMLPVLKAIEKYEGGTEAPNERGTHGALNMMQNGDPTGVALVNAMAQAYDVPALQDYNVNVGNVVSAAQRLVKLTPDNRRVRVWGADLLPANIVDREGNAVDGRKLRILYNSTVDKIHFEDPNDPNRATHVSFVTYNKEIHKIRVKKGVILTGGVIGTPGVLQRSGIGPLTVLQEAGVKPKIVNEHVGRHFKIHLGITTPYDPATFPTMSFPGPIPNQGVMAFDDGHVVGYNEDGVRRYEHLMGGLGVMNANVAAQLGIPLNAPTVNNWYLRPRSEGTIAISSTDPQILPTITPNLLSDGGLDDPDSDATAMVRSAKEAKLLADALGSKLLFPTQDAFEKGDEALLLAVRCGWSVTSHFHQYARMGTSPDNSVVDSKLRVWNTPNIWVGDMGVAAGFVSGHTALPAFAIGAKLAQILGYPVEF
jgi:choline dehydrogenase